MELVLSCDERSESKRKGCHCVRNGKEVVSSNVTYGSIGNVRSYPVQAPSHLLDENFVVIDHFPEHAHDGPFFNMLVHEGKVGFITILPHQLANPLHMNGITDNLRPLLIRELNLGEYFSVWAFRRDEFAAAAVDASLVSRLR